jgi:hypothetical protein
MDVKHYDCRQRNVDNKAVERGRGILRKTAGLSQNDPKDKTKDQQSNVYHGMPRSRWVQLLAARTGGYEPVLSTCRAADGSAAIVNRTVSSLRVLSATERHVRFASSSDAKGPKAHSVPSIRWSKAMDSYLPPTTQNRRSIGWPFVT